MTGTSLASSPNSPRRTQGLPRQFLRQRHQRQRPPPHLPRPSLPHRRQHPQLAAAAQALPRGVLPRLTPAAAKLPITAISGRPSGGRTTTCRAVQPASGSSWVPASERAITDHPLLTPSSSKEVCAGFLYSTIGGDWRRCLTLRQSFSYWRCGQSLCRAGRQKRSTCAPCFGLIWLL